MTRGIPYNKALNFFFKRPEERLRRMVRDSLAAQIIDFLFLSLQ